MYPPHIQKIIDLPKEQLTAAQIAPITGQDPNTIRYMARNMPERLPFPCIVGPTGRRVWIPKWPFLNAFGYSREEAT